MKFFNLNYAWGLRCERQTPTAKLCGAGVQKTAA